MGNVRFGVAIGAFAGAVAARQDLVGLARRAEALGLDSVQTGDHVQWHAPILESTTLMATFAAVTERIRIASDVIILPLRDPVLFAKTIASLDVISGGRLVLGIGVGGDNPAEYAAMRVPLSERGARTDEALVIVKGLLENERFSYQGRHFSITDVAIAPRPVQSRVPVWVGGTSEAALRRAARHGDGWIGAFAGDRKFQGLVADLRDRLAEAGRSSADFTVGSFVFTTLDPDPARARAVAVEHVERVYRLPGERVIDRYGAAGPSAACAEKVARLVEAGANYIVFYPLCPCADWPRQLDGYADVIERVGRTR